MVMEQKCNVVLVLVSVLFFSLESLVLALKPKVHQVHCANRLLTTDNDVTGVLLVKLGVVARFESDGIREGCDAN